MELIKAQMFQLDHEEYRTITMVVLGVDKVVRVVNRPILDDSHSNQSGRPWFSF